MLNMTGHQGHALGSEHLALFWEAIWHCNFIYARGTCLTVLLLSTGCPPGSWVWHGNSLHAFAPDTRGKGVFDGHVSGSLVMKELRCEDSIQEHAQRAQCSHQMFSVPIMTSTILLWY